MTGPAGKGEIRSLPSAERGGGWTAAGPARPTNAKRIHAISDRIRHEAAAAPKRKAGS